jgi:hypothetical protein
LSPFCTCCPLLWAILCCSLLGIMEGQEWPITSLWQWLKLPWWAVETCRTDHRSKWEQWALMMRLHPGAGTVISWEQDDSHQVMTVMTSFLEPLWEPLNWDNGQPDHTCDWYCLPMHTFVSSPQFFDT